MYLEKPLHAYLDDLASASPTPGGGSTAALSGAMAAALASMVARLTLGKAEYAPVQAEITTLIQQTEQSRDRFQQLVQADIAAYGQLSASFKLPRATGEEKAARTQAIQTRLLEAALVPLEMAERAAELAQHCQRIAQIGNKNVLSDIATSVALLSCAGSGASSMVRVNTLALKDQVQAAELDSRLQAALESVATGTRHVLQLVGERA